MKKIVMAASLTLVAALGACENMLQENPRAFITTQNYYKTAADLNLGVLAGYDALMAAYRQANHGWWGGPGMASDQEESHPTEVNLEAYAMQFLIYTPENTGRSNVGWNNFYQAIVRSNLVLDRASGVEMTESQRAQLVAEAKFLRGFSYLQLDKGYSSGTQLTDLSVPLQLTEADHIAPEAPRNTVAEVHAQILKDLTEAEAALPTRTQRGVAGRGRATKGAAQMALADFHLWRSSFHSTNEWQQASDWAKKVIDSGQYGLVQNGFFNIFNASNKANNNEQIFFIVATGTPGRQISHFVNQHAPRDLGFGIGGGFGSNRATQWHVDSYIPGDVRGVVGQGTRQPGMFENDTVAYRNYACSTQRVNHPGFVQLGPTNFCGPLPFGSIYPYKFRPRELVSNRGDVDIPLYRFAETLLIYAEAQNELGHTDEAIRNVNLVRARARRGALGTENRVEPADLPTAMSKQAARDAIFMERNWELAHESKRWWDLIRRDSMEPGFWANSLIQNDPASASQLPDLAQRTYLKRFPIPARETDLSPELMQNPGY